MPTTTLHLVRHGEVLTDAGLTSVGLEQAEATAHSLRHADVDIVLHSSGRRAIETAQAIATKATPAQQAAMAPTALLGLDVPISIG